MLRILLVDDDLDLLSALEQVLRGKGCSVDITTDAEAAIEKLAARTFDLVVSDVQLPTVDGLTLLRRVRREFPSIEVLLMTAYGSIGDAVTAIKDSAIDYVRKPFDVAHLVAVVERIERRRRVNNEPATPG